MRIRFPATCIVATFIDLVWPDAIARPTQLGHLFYLTAKCENRQGIPPTIRFAPQGCCVQSICPSHRYAGQTRRELLYGHRLCNQARKLLSLQGLAQFNSFCAHYVRHN